MKVQADSSMLFTSNTGIQPGPDAFEESRLVMTFFYVTLRVTETYGVSN